MQNQRRIALVITIACLSYPVIVAFTITQLVGG